MALVRNQRRKEQSRPRPLGYTLPGGRRVELAPEHSRDIAPDDEPKASPNPVDLVSVTLVLIGLLTIGTGVALAWGVPVALVVLGGLILVTGLLMAIPFGGGRASAQMGPYARME